MCGTGGVGRGVLYWLCGTGVWDGFVWDGVCRTGVLHGVYGTVGV